jgi:hypothetical protein
MSISRGVGTRIWALLLAMGAILAVPARPAHAHEFHFRQEFTLSEAGLQSVDAFGAFWFFSRGKIVVDVDAWVGDHRECFVSFAAVGSGSGLNYKLGTSGGLSFIALGADKCFVDPIDGVLRASARFELDLLGAGGGTIPSEIRLAITPSGVSISGVTIGIDPSDWD